MRTSALGVAPAAAGAMPLRMQMVATVRGVGQLVRLAALQEAEHAAEQSRQPPERSLML